MAVSSDTSGGAAGVPSAGSFVSGYRQGGPARLDLNKFTGFSDGNEAEVPYAKTLADRLKPRVRRVEIPEWIRPSLLQEKFQGGPWTSNPGWKRKRGSRLSQLEVQFICLSLAQGRPVAEIARSLECTPAAIWARVRRLKNDTGEMYANQVIVSLSLPPEHDRVVYFCRLCGAAADTLAKGAIHAFLHIFPDGGGLIPVR